VPGPDRGVMVML